MELSQTCRKNEAKIKELQNYILEKVIISIEIEMLAERKCDIVPREKIFDLFTDGNGIFFKDDKIVHLQQLVEKKDQKLKKARKKDKHQIDVSYIVAFSCVYLLPL